MSRVPSQNVPGRSARHHREDRKSWLDRRSGRTAWLIAAVVAGVFIWFWYFALGYWITSSFGSPCQSGERWAGWRASGEPFLIAFILGGVLLTIGDRAVKSLPERLWWPILAAFVVAYVSGLVVLSVVAPAIWGSPGCVEARG